MTALKRNKKPRLSLGKPGLLSFSATLYFPDHADGLLALPTGGDFERNVLTLIQGLETVTLDLTVMDEDVITAFQGYESISLAVVEPFDCSFSHYGQLLYKYTGGICRKTISRKHTIHSRARFKKNGRECQ